MTSFLQLAIILHIICLIGYNIFIDFFLIFMLKHSQYLYIHIEFSTNLYPVGNWVNLKLTLSLLFNLC